MSKKTSGKSVLEIPKEIRELALGFRKQRVGKELAEKQRKRDLAAEEKRVQAARLKKGWEIADKVFVWAHALKDSDLGQELMKKSHIPTAYSSILFFDAGIVGRPWVGIGISPNGLFLTHGGRLHNPKHIHSPKDLARSVDTITLKIAREWIDNGEVWNCIKRRFEYLKKLP